MELYLSVARVETECGVLGGILAVSDGLTRGRGKPADTIQIFLKGRDMKSIVLLISK